MQNTDVVYPFFCGLPLNLYTLYDNYEPAFLMAAAKLPGNKAPAVITGIAGYRGRYATPGANTRVEPGP